MRRFVSLHDRSAYSSWRRPARCLPLLALSLVLTGLNALKPLHMDDFGFHRYAAQIAREPLSPYGFEIIWDHVPRPAIEILAPPVLPYWWGLGIRLFGQRPVFWKLWLLPFSVVLVFSLHALLRHLVRRHTMPLVWMTVLSPAFLPGFNLMSDIPAVSLSLFAVAVFLRAVTRDSMPLALVAGLLTGLAMQTKYTAFTIPAVLLLYAILSRRVVLGLAASTAAVLLFVAWECLVFAVYGSSHFLCTCVFFHDLNPSTGAKLIRMLLALPTLTGGLAPAVMLLGLAAVERSRRLILATGAAIVFGYLLLLFVPEPWVILLRSPQSAKPLLTLENVVYGALGAGLCLSTVAIIRRLLRGAASLHPFPRIEWFLVLWLALEVAGYLLLPPFPAARRVLSLVVVGTLLAGRLAGRTCLTPTRATLPRWIAVGGVILGLAFYGVDWRDAWAQKQAAEDAARLARSHDKAGTTWVVAIWGFEFYAEHAGLQPLVLGRSQVRQGDRVVIFDDYVFCLQPFRPEEAPLRVADHVIIEDALPLRTVVSYYCGATPLRHQQGPRARATVYQATADFVPRSPVRRFILHPAPADTARPPQPRTPGEAKPTAVRWRGRAIPIG